MKSVWMITATAVNLNFCFQFATTQEVKFLKLSNNSSKEKDRQWENTRKIKREGAKKEKERERERATKVELSRIHSPQAYQISDEEKIRSKLLRKTDLNLLTPKKLQCFVSYLLLISWIVVLASLYIDVLQHKNKSSYKTID